MSLQFILIYSTTVFVASIIPGPSMILALNHGIKYGPKRTLVTAFGNFSATLIQAFISMAGLGAILLQSEAAFNIIKFLGSFYLIYIGIRTFFSPVHQGFQVEQNSTSSFGFKRLYLEAFIVTIGNPKAIIFFTALFPQFIDTQHDTIYQFTVIISILSVIAFGCMMIYGICGHKVLRILNETKAAKALNRFLGTTLIGMGIGLALDKAKKI